MRFNRIFTCALFSLLLVSCWGSSNDSKNYIQYYVQSPEAPIGTHSVDGNEVKLNGAIAKRIMLNNNLKVTLVSSPTSSKSAFSIGVNVGHMDNPIEAQGLAHYLEHMLFLGTEEFPNVDGYKQFVSENGGFFNAYTSATHTNYHVDVKNDAFEEAVHRTSRFFVSPLFDETYSEIEKNAVENEFRLLFEAFVPRRTLSVFYREDSKNRLFPVGNLATLSHVTAQDTREYWEEQYYAEAMYAVLAGPQSLEELESLAVKYLSDIKSKPEKPLNVHTEANLIDQSKLPAKVLSRPIVGKQSSLRVLIPFNQDQDNQGILSALSVLIGHKGETSLMKVLVDEGWINANLNDYFVRFYRRGIYFILDNLTEKGRREKSKILSYIYTYLNFITSSGVPTYLSNEFMAAKKASSTFTTYYEVNIGTASGIVAAYFSNNESSSATLSELLFGKQLKDFSDEEYKAVLGQLNWSKRLIFDTDPNNPVIDRDFNEIENLEIGGFKIVDLEDGRRVIEDSIYDFSFEVVGVEEATLQKGLNFSLPPKNPYSPTDFEVYNTNPTTNKYQKALSPWGEIYWSDLGETGEAYTRLSLDLYSHGINFDSNKDVVSLFLMRELLKKQVLFKADPLVQMGYEYGFSINIFEGFLTLKFNGWSDNYLKAFNDFLTLSNLTPKEEDFNSIKVSYSDKIIDERESGTRGFISRQALSHVTKVYINYDEVLETLANLDYSTYTDFTRRFAEGMYFRGAISGDLLPTYPNQIVESITKTWEVEETGLAPDFSISRLAEEVIQNNELQVVSDVGSSSKRSNFYAIRNLGPVESVREVLAFNILSKWLGTDYYVELRTNQGLAYSLSAYFSLLVGHNMLVTNLSSLETAEFTSGRSDEFIDLWIEEILPTKSQELFDITVATLKNAAQSFPLSPRLAHRKYYELASSGFQSLKDLQNEVAIYDEITLEEVINLGQQKLLNQPKAGVVLKVEKFQ